MREADTSEADEALSRIIDVLSNLNLPSPVVDKTTLESAVSECNDDVQPENSDKVGILSYTFRPPDIEYAYLNFSISIMKVTVAYEISQVIHQSNYFSNSTQKVCITPTLLYYLTPDVQCGRCVPDSPLQIQLREKETTPGHRP